jgi:hypothetical protein
MHRFNADYHQQYLATAARTRAGKVDRTRPLCPYPRQAVYKGSDSTDDAANFSGAVQ